MTGNDAIDNNMRKARNNSFIPLRQTDFRNADEQESFCRRLREQLGRGVQSPALNGDEILKVKLTGRRYDEIRNNVKRIIDQADLRDIPISAEKAADKLGYNIIAYRQLGKETHELVMKASMDALLFTDESTTGRKRYILFNDRMPASRINFSIAHEMGHGEEGHKEHSALAEVEANHLAATLLCPLELLEHFGIFDAKNVARVFSISESCAKNRISAVKNRMKRRHVPESEVEYAQWLAKRFSLKRPYQPDLFEAGASEPKIERKNTNGRQRNICGGQ